jgi:quinol monooxygenase YgiN
MDQVLVVVHMLFAKGETEAAIDALTPAAELSQQEPGCIKFAVHRDVDDPDVLLIIEEWESRDAYESHLKQPHLQQLNETMVPLFAGVPRISVSRGLGIGDETKGVI